MRQPVEFSRLARIGHELLGCLLLELTSSKLTGCTLILLIFQVFSYIPLQCSLMKRTIHLSSVCQKKRAGRYRRSVKGDKPITYEMAYPPHRIAHWKSWNSWNTCKTWSLSHFITLCSNVKHVIRRIRGESMNLTSAPCLDLGVNIVL